MALLRRLPTDGESHMVFRHKVFAIFTLTRFDASAEAIMEFLFYELNLSASYFVVCCLPK